jgi:hypothetical protein
VAVALELALRRAACVSLVLACARPLFLEPAYRTGLPWLLSHSMLVAPRLVLGHASAHLARFSASVH